VSYPEWGLGETWRELDRPIKYAVRGDANNTVVPVKVFSMVPNWNGATKARTLTLFPNDRSEEGVIIDYPYSDVYDNKKDALQEVFLRTLKGKRQ